MLARKACFNTRNTLYGRIQINSMFRSAMADGRLNEYSERIQSSSELYSRTRTTTATISVQWKRFEKSTRGSKNGKLKHQPVMANGVHLTIIPVRLDYYFFPCFLVLFQRFLCHDSTETPLTLNFILLWLIKIKL